MSEALCARWNLLMWKKASYGLKWLAANYEMLVALYLPNGAAPNLRLFAALVQKSRYGGAAYTAPPARALRAQGKFALTA